MNEWHFSRKKLAAHYLDKLDLGLSKSLAIFAPRRKGKSEFALMDLIPLAMERNYFPVYSSLWSDLDSPQNALIEDLKAYTDALQSRSKLSDILNSKIKKLTVNLYGVAKGEFEFPGNAVAPSHDDISIIRSLVTHLAGSANRKLMLIVDEIQHLTTSASFDRLSHTLRTLLDSIDQIHGVFTGSSRSGMGLLFGDKSSPFFQFVLQEAFPDLDMEFVRFLLKKARTDYGLLVSEKEFDRAFRKLDSSPYWAKKMLELLIMKEAGNVKDAMATTLDILVTANQYEQIAHSLTPVDKAVYLRAAERKSMFSVSAVTEISAKVEENVTKSRIQKSVNKLIERGYLSKMLTGSYEIELMGFSEWLRQQNQS